MEKINSPEHIHFTSLLVQILPSAKAKVTRFILAQKGREIIEHGQAGKLIVLIEAENEHEITDFLSSISPFPGVLNATLVYHHIEQKHQLEDLIEPSDLNPKDNETAA